MPPMRSRGAVPAVGVQQPVLLKRDAHRRIAAGHQPREVGGKPIAEPVGIEPLACGRLHQERRTDLPNEFRDRLPPASVVRELHDIDTHRGFARRSTRTNPAEQRRRRLRLDIPCHQHARSRFMRDVQHQREVVVTRGSEPATRPHHADIECTDPQRVSRRHGPQRHATLRNAREKGVDRGHALRARNERVVHHHLTHLAEPHDVEQAAEVIEVGMRHEHRPHPSARLRDGRHERA